MRIVARACSISTEPMASGPISRPRASSTRIRTGPREWTIETARRRPASVVTSQVNAARKSTTNAAVPASSHFTTCAPERPSQNSGVKLMWKRGLRSGSEIDCATSMPMLRNGSR